MISVLGQDSASNMISRTSCAHRHARAIRAAHINASSREDTSIMENPPSTAFFSGTGSEEYSNYWNLLSDPLAGSQLGRENNTFGRSGAHLWCWTRKQATWLRVM